MPTLRRSRLLLNVFICVSMAQTAPFSCVIFSIKLARSFTGCERHARKHFLIELLQNENGALGELTHDVHVVVGEAEGGRFRRTAEPRPAGRGDKRLHVHNAII